ncbi:unnamed protein product [Schistosoma rodhaini]|uniref:Uncharacterized protein n=1 Tax=Schistosoma rodhaini TaxID=6188 RepID=A0AA85FKE3_9TREM|nr:unnamed protein product [Schistosoma rodhaini]
MSSNEVFSFPVTILDGPDGEENFEMARARIWQLRRKSDWSFDRLVADLTPSSQCELTFEMIHMVSYVEKVAPPGMLSVFPSPFQSAEAWIRDRWIFRENNSAKSMEHTLPLKKGLRIADPVSPSNHAFNNELKNRKVMKVDQNSTTTVSGPTVHKANRSLPGFQTILQCGKTLVDDTLLGKTDTDTSYEYPSLSLIHTSNSQQETLHYPSDSPPYMLVGRSRESLEKNYESSSKQISTRASLKSDNGSKRNNSGHFLMTSEKSQNLINSENTDIGQSKSNMLNIFYDPLGLETTNCDNSYPVVDRNKKVSNPSHSLHTSDGRHNLLESKDNALDDISTKMNVCMDDTFLLEFLDRNLAGTDSKTNANFAERCGLNSPTAFVEDMIKKAQKTLNHQYKC